MAEYIEREAFMEYWNKEFRHLYPNDKYLVALANFPTADVVEVVRCKDCIHYDYQYRREKWESAQKSCCRSAIVKVRPNDYCSFGLRKGDVDG